MNSADADGSRWCGGWRTPLAGGLRCSQRVKGDDQWQTMSTQPLELVKHTKKESRIIIVQEI